MSKTAPLIGLLTSSLKVPFVDRTVAGACEVFAERGATFKAIELHGLSPLDYHRYIEQVANDPELDGLIYCHLRLNASQIGRFQQRHLPLVGVTERAEGIDWVTVDEAKGAYLATRHLLGLGHKRIALLNGPLLSEQARLREDGFVQALKEAGLRVSRESGVQLLNFTEDEGQEAANMLLDLTPPPTAIFSAAGDLAARGAWEALKRRGKSVPRDMSVVGFDGLYFAAEIGLSTIEQPLEAMGRWGAERVLDRVAGKASGQGHQLFEPVLVARGSSGPAPT